MSITHHEIAMHAGEPANISLQDIPVSVMKVHESSPPAMPDCLKMANRGLQNARQGLKSG